MRAGWYHEQSTKTAEMLCTVTTFSSILQFVGKLNDLAKRHRRCAQKSKWVNEYTDLRTCRVWHLAVGLVTRAATRGAPSRSRNMASSPLSPSPPFFLPGGTSTVQCDNSFVLNRGATSKVLCFITNLHQHHTAHREAVQGREIHELEGVCQRWRRIVRESTQVKRRKYEEKWVAY